MEATCKRCQHTWNYKGKKLELPGDFPIYVLCPSCKTSVVIKRVVEDEDGKQQINEQLHNSHME